MKIIRNGNPTALKLIGSPAVLLLNLKNII